MLGWLSRTARGVEAQWFWADTRQQLPGLSLALMALLLAMAANIGVSTMVSSFRLTFTGFLDQRLASELYVDAATAEEAAALAGYLAPRVEAVLPIQSVETRVAGQPAEVFGPRDHATYTDNWALLDGAADAWPRTFAGEGALVNEQLARRAALSLGDAIEVGGRKLPVLGIYGDYGNPIGQVLIGEDLFAQLFPQARPRQFGLRLPAEEVPALIADLRERFDLPPDAVIDQASVKALSLRIFDRTFTVTGALNLLTLAVAGFSILMSLLTLAAMRLPQLAPVWAMGFTRARLGRLELLRAVMLAGFTAILAIPLGLVLAWVLLAVVNVAAFGWRLPMHVFPVEYLRLTVLALAAAALAAAWPAWRLATLAPARLLQVFAHER